MTKKVRNTTINRNPLHSISMDIIRMHSKRVVTPSGIKEATISIKNGIIKSVVEGSLHSGTEGIIDYGNLVIMPGIIDPHVHINEPGRTEWEGFETATSAAFAGGITTLVDMPLNSSPVTTSVKAFEEKLSAAKGKLHTNCFFWGGVVPGNEKEIEPLIEKGVRGFKAFLTHSGIDEFPNVTRNDLEKAMPIIAKHRLPLLVHCELTDEIIRAKGDVRSYQNYLDSRPKEWEDNAIKMMIELCEKYNCHVHIVHLSSANSIQQISEAKKRGLPLTVETGQHYLYFNAEDIPYAATAYKCAPPIRERANNELLWQALKDGIIDFVATDHSPSTPDLKELESGNFMKAWGGIASVQFALPVLWTAAKKHNCTIENIAKWMCENPAKLIGMTDRKGKIVTGYDADITIWDDENKFIVTKEMILHRHKVTPYLGEELYGVVEKVVVGRLSYEH